MAPQKGMEWLHQLGPGTLDTDLTDEEAWQARPEFAAKSKARYAAEAAEMKAKVKSDKKGIVEASVTKLDTDHTDEEAWKARKKLAEASKARKAAEAAKIKAENDRFKQMVKKTESSDEIDDDLRDEIEWAKRFEFMDAARARREREKKDLAVKNAEIRDRLNHVGPVVAVTSPFGKYQYEENPPKEWIQPYKFDSRKDGTRAQIMMRTKDAKYLDEDNFGNDYIAFRMTSSGRGDRPPSWLQPAGSSQPNGYDWAV